MSQAMAYFKSLRRGAGGLLACTSLAVPLLDSFIEHSHK